MYEKSLLSKQVLPVQNTPIPLKIPREAQNQIWGGEGVVQGFQKSVSTKRRVPHFWIPVLRRSVVKSEVLNEYISVVVTNRTMRLIHEHHGFDHYLLKTPACDLKQLLPIKLKRRILEALLAGCPNLVVENPKRRQFVMAEYSKYLLQYTPNEIEWYGLTFEEALEKAEVESENEQSRILPHKLAFRQRLIEQLKETGSVEAQGVYNKQTNSWVSRLNPFSNEKKGW